MLIALKKKKSHIYEPHQLCSVISSTNMPDHLSAKIAILKNISNFYLKSKAFFFQNPSKMTLVLI